MIAKLRDKRILIKDPNCHQQQPRSFQGHRPTFQLFLQPQENWSRIGKRKYFHPQVLQCSQYHYDENSVILQYKLTADMAVGNQNLMYLQQKSLKFLQIYCRRVWLMFHPCNLEQMLFQINKYCEKGFCKMIL